jgi:hypothetical protein
MPDERPPKARDDNPSTKPLLDKLGVKPDMRVAVLGIDDESFLSELGERVSFGRDPQGAEMVFLAVNEPEHMTQLSQLKEQIARNGAVWVVFRKGQKVFNENDVLRLGLESGMVDVKVVRFSDKHSATKFVIRKAER